MTTLWGAFYEVHYKSSLGSKENIAGKHTYYHIMPHSKETLKTPKLKWFSQICAGSEQNKWLKNNVILMI
jgi:hypothetical protein